MTCDLLTDRKLSSLYYFIQIIIIKKQPAGKESITSTDTYNAYMNNVLKTCISMYINTYIVVTKSLVHANTTNLNNIAYE